MIAFSTAREPRTQLSNDSMSPLFEAVIEATEEAIYNSLLRAHDTSGRGHTVKALPLRETLDVLRKYNAIALTQSDYLNRLQAIAQDISALKPEFAQLSKFSVAKNTRTDQLEITYGYHTHNPQHRGGWTSGVPNPDDDGVWFYIDFHDAGSTAQIHTQPIYPALHLGDRVVEFLILEGATTKSVGGRITAILKAHGAQ